MGAQESDSRSSTSAVTEKRVAIVQSNYIPWKGYFDLINLVDEFILYDDAQYTRRDWRNRNRIKTRDGVKWLTIPVEVKGKYHQAIRDVRISESGWARRHWETIRHSYARAPYFAQYEDFFSDLYRRCAFPYLSEVNRHFLGEICRLLGIRTKLSWSFDYRLVPGRNERLVELCRQAGATHYYSGPSARSYLDEQLFAETGITVHYVDYSSYPEYPQLFPPFEHAVSILDLILNTGPEAPHYMKSFGSPRGRGVNPRGAASSVA
jgi:hypothetical protein